MLGLVVFGCLQASGQARLTATQTFRLSAFGGADGTFTGLNGCKNIGMTAGVDLGFRPIFRITPSIEVRGTVPFYKGSIDHQKNLLVGVKLEHRFGRFHPYGDGLFGRGQIDYSFPYTDPTGFVAYTQTVSNVFAGGGGVDYDINRHFALKVDGQYQRYETPVTVSGTLYAKALTVGVVYRLDFNRRTRNVKYK